jgi:putative transposase
MLVLEAKLEGTKSQYAILDEIICTARFIRNACIWYWMDNPRERKRLGMRMTSA